MPEGSNSFVLSISIAGISTCLFFSGLSAEKQRLLQTWYAAFSVSTDQVVACRDAARIDVQVEPGDLFIPFRPGPWLVQTFKRGDRIEFKSHQEKGWFDLVSLQGELTLRPEGNPENFLRVMYAWRCLAGDALVLHASGVIRNGGGYVFFGPSGSGKTTIASLSPDAIILSDDLVILQCGPSDRPEDVRVYGVPFRGEMIEAARTNTSAPLLGLFTLVKDSTHRLVDMHRIEAAARLSTCVPFVMSQPENAQRALALCEKITRLVHVKELHFWQDTGFWKVVDG